MPYMWVRKNNNRKYCCRCSISTCYLGSIYASPDPDTDPDILEAIEAINEILDRLKETGANTEKVPAWLVVPDDKGEGVLTLDWVYLDDELTTWCGEATVGATP